MSEWSRVNSSRNSSQCHKTQSPQSGKPPDCKHIHFLETHSGRQRNPQGKERAPLQHKESCKHVQLMQRMINVGLDSQQQHLVKSNNVHSRHHAKFLPDAGRYNHSGTCTFDPRLNWAHRWWEEKKKPSKIVKSLFLHSTDISCSKHSSVPITCSWQCRRAMNTHLQKNCN